MKYTTTTALGMEDTHEVSFLFQKWTAEQGWSRGQGFERFADAEQEQKDFYAMREGTAREKQPTRIIEVTATTSFKCINQP